MGYVHSPHDHPENTDRELAAAIREALAVAEDNAIKMKYWYAQQTAMEQGK